MTTNSYAIILVAPQMGENIGAAARVMKNFGIFDLRIVSPRDGWPNAAADAMSVGAIDVIKNAQVYSSLQDAFVGIDRVYAATAQSRDMAKESLSVAKLSDDISVHTSSDSRSAIMFGKESSGLSNQEISFANKIVYIPTHIGLSSLNLAQAVAIVCYEIFSSVGINNTESHINTVAEKSMNLASVGDINMFSDSLINELLKTDFFRVKEKSLQMQISIRNLFNKLVNLSATELHILYGIVRALIK